MYALRCLYSDGSIWRGSLKSWPASPATSLSTIGVLYVVLYLEAGGRIFFCGHDFYSVREYPDYYHIAEWADYNPFGRLYRFNRDWSYKLSSFNPRNPPVELIDAPYLRLGEWVADKQWAHWQRIIMDDPQWQLP